VLLVILGTAINLLWTAYNRLYHYFSYLGVISRQLNCSVSLRRLSCASGGNYDFKYMMNVSLTRYLGLESDFRLHPPTCKMYISCDQDINGLRAYVVIYIFLLVRGISRIIINP
jgi:hypothetical protein